MRPHIGHPELVGLPADASTPLRAVDSPVHPAFAGAEYTAGIGISRIQAVG